MLTMTEAELQANIRKRKIVDMAYAIGGFALITLSLAVLVALIYTLFRDGATRLGWDFLSSFPSRRPENAGIKSAFVGTILVMFVTAFTAIPLGAMAGIYLEEYGKKNWLTTIIEINIANLAGVPSIIWGLMALGLFIYKFEDWFGNPNDLTPGLGRSVLTAGLTLGLLVLPIVIVATREAIRAIPQGIREASYACGATRLQTVQSHILPYSLSGMLTGAIIALSRAIGETAPLITIGALTFIAFLPPAPFASKPYLNSTAMTVGISEDKRDMPLSELYGASVTDGTIRFHIKPGSEDDTKEVPHHETVTVAATDSITQVEEKIEAIEGLTADFYGDLLNIQADFGVVFIIEEDTTGLIAASGISPGGGRFGPMEWIQSGFTVMPIQMFNWVSKPNPEFHANAAAAGIVLLIMTLSMNGTAIVLRSRLRKRIQW